MLSVYIASAVVGIALILVGAFSGLMDGDSDLGHVAPDHGAGLDLAAIPFFSLRFWTYFFAAFGVIGVTSTLFKNPNALLTSTIVGLLLGTLVFALMRYAKKSESGFVPSPSDIVGARGKVLVTVKAEEHGKVRLNLQGEMIDFLALSDSDSTIPVTSEVLVSSIEGSTVRVTNLTKIIQEELK